MTKQLPPGLERLMGLAGRMSKDRFVATSHHPFLVLDARAVDDGFEFDTHVAKATDAAGFDDRSRRTEIVELVKSSRNPFADRISIGRATNCDIVLSDGSVSKLHAHVRAIGGVLHIADVGSQNGTFLDGKQLVAQAPAPFRIGARVRFGSVGALLANAATVYDLVAAMINEQD